MTTSGKTPKQPQPGFEETYTQLRETVEKLEGGGLTLDEATRLYDQGIRLAKVCNELLSATELQISRLQRSYGEQMAMIPDTSSPEDIKDDSDETSKAAGEEEDD
jgi:exodeoxyribonuclease VII small subunit